MLTVHKSLGADGGLCKILGLHPPKPPSSAIPVPIRFPVIRSSLYTFLVSFNKQPKMMTITPSNGIHAAQKPLPPKEEEKTLVNHDELQYLNLIKSVIEHGKKKSDRTGKMLILVCLRIRYRSRRFGGNTLDFFKCSRKVPNINIQRCPSCFLGHP